MVDVMTVKQRRRLMSRVKSKNTFPEMQLRKAIWAKGGRYRLSVKLPGKPDLVFRKARLAVFVDGCFWHQCPEHGAIPESNREFWVKKLQANIERDRRVNKELQALGWEVVRLWEHEINRSVEFCADLVLKKCQLLLSEE